MELMPRSISRRPTFLQHLGSRSLRGEAVLQACRHQQNLLQIWTEKAEPGAALLCLPSTQRGCSASPAAPDPPHLSPELVSAAPNLAQLKTLAAALHRCTLRGKCCLFVLRSSLDTCKQACILLNASVVMSSYVINISSIPMLD